MTRWALVSLLCLTLPHLDEPSITVSRTAHTARVSGYLPEGWNTPLPYYVDSIHEAGRTKIAVVYPIATTKR